MVLSKRFSLMVLLLFPGCGHKDIYPVHGRVVDSAGKPLTELKGGAVEFESLDGKGSANGAIADDATFTLTTKQPGDGAHVGKHRVLITRPYFGPDRPAPFTINPKYERPETSGLEVVVEPKNNEVELKVERIRGQQE